MSKQFYTEKLQTSYYIFQILVTTAYIKQFNILIAAENVACLRGGFGGVGPHLMFSVRIQII